MVTQKVLQPKKSPRLTAGKKSADPTLWADIIAMGKSLPAEVRDRIPRDAATHFDEYVSGRRKKR